MDDKVAPMTLEQYLAVLIEARADGLSYEECAILFSLMREPGDDRDWPE